MQYIIMSILAIFFGQVVSHLVQKLPPVVSEEITYSQFFKSLKFDFKFDFKYSIIFLILFNALGIFLENNITIYLYTIVCAALAIAFSIDYKYQLIPDEVHILIVFVGIINLFMHITLWYNFLLGALIGGAIFYLLNLLALLIFKKEGMGFGDVKLMASLGFLFGIKYILVIALVSFILGAIVGGSLMIIKKMNSDSYIPFGPFIVIAAILLMFIPADTIIDIYISFCSWLGMKMSDALYFVMCKLGVG
ncbi:MAG: A24 family peptidase [Clostridia bacterium]